YCIHPKESPLAFTIIRHANSALSIPLSALCVFIVKKSHTVTREYANFLVALLLGSVFVDIFTQWIFNPVFLLPLMCIYR
ncbi:hypothetical protein PENTCL1PPCAC_24367, partial [Pristionchus entomophagus]